jgi:hypothetical protein
MAGIIFFKTNDLQGMKSFYLDEVGCTLWLDQGDCLIFRHGNLLLGFVQRPGVDREGMITFFYEKKREVDRFFEKFKERAKGPPRMNEKYRIYHFFAEDPEGRALEFQFFDHELPPY